VRRTHDLLRRGEKTREDVEALRIPREEEEFEDEEERSTQ
jgi:hypothetical protein